MTKLAQWQISDSSNDTITNINNIQFENTVRTIMIKYIRTQINKMSTPDDWTEYLNKIYDTTDSWTHCPDKLLYKEWNIKYQHLVAFYTEVINAHKVLSHDSHLSEIYKDKIDQAMDCMLDENAIMNERCYPLVLIDADMKGITILEAANNIFRKRQRWSISMAMFERTRLIGIRHILAANNEDILTVCSGYIESIRRLYTNGY